MAGLAWAFSAQLRSPLCSSQVLPRAQPANLEEDGLPVDLHLPLCGLLAANLVGATLTPPVVLSLSTEVIKQSKSWPPRPYHCKAGAGGATLQGRVGVPHH